MSRPRRRRLVLLGALLLVVTAALPAAADSTPAWKVAIEVEPDGSFVVTEDITQQFDIQRHGIYRYIPVTEEIAAGGLVAVPDGEPQDWFQRIRISDIAVGSDTAPTGLDVTKPSRHDANGVVTIRIGDEDRTITGQHTYRVRYRVEGAMLALDDDTSVLRWDVVGPDWQQVVARAEVTVTGPGIRPSQGVCAIAGLTAPVTCTTVGESTDSFRAVADGELLYSPMSVAVPFARDAVAASEPILQRRFTLAGALFGSPAAWPLAAVLGLGLFALLARLLYREGRDREARGGVTVDGRYDGTHAQVAPPERTRGLFAGRTIPVEFRPPGDLRPGELGLVLDERVDPVDISATIVDLAVRGHLTITEDVSKTLWWSNTDWVLTAREADRSGLRAYEVEILDGLFDGRSTVNVGELKGTFSTTYNKVERDLYDVGTDAGWFPRNPYKVRGAWLGIAVVSLLASLGALALAVYFTRVAIAAVPLVLAALVLLIAHRWMPRRTARGSALLTQTLGFRHFIETAEANRAQFAERENLFVEYLPYAVVFGATDKWARAFAGLGIMASGSALGGWYVGSHVGGFDAGSFSRGMGDFSAAVGTATSAAPPSSSGGSGGGGGFSGGGGFGGGGGGSW